MNNSVSSMNKSTCRNRVSLFSSGMVWKNGNVFNSSMMILDLSNALISLFPRTKEGKFGSRNGEKLKECFNREPFQFVDDDLSLASFSLSLDVEHASKELKGTELGETGMGSLQNDRKALRAFRRRIRGPLERFLERLDALKDRRNFVEARL